MMYPGEDRAIAQVLVYGDRYGYGNLISRLQEAWEERLLKSGLNKEAAKLGSWQLDAWSEMVKRSEMVKKEEIKKSLEKVLSTPYGERPMLPEFGTKVRELMKLEEMGEIADLIETAAFVAEHESQITDEQENRLIAFAKGLRGKG